jgi:hypothetical protein
MRMLAAVQEGKLTRLWVRAMASLPLGWRLLGVMNRDAPGAGEFWNSTDDEWAALAQPDAAAGTTSGLVVGYGSAPEQALADLAEKLRQLRGNPNG